MRRVTLVIIVVVILIVPTSMVILFTTEDFGPDDMVFPDPTFDPVIEDFNTTTEVTEDWTWEDRDQRRTGTVRVHPGAHLKIVDSYLTFRLEDFVLYEQPPFVVMPGGKLTIEDSTFVIRKDETSLSSVYFGLRDRGRWWNARETPILSRVVNLEGTDDPVLRFQTDFRILPPDMMVFGQRRLGGRLIHLETIEGNAPEGVWQQHEVSLEPLGDRIARVAITTVDMSFGAWMVSQTFIEDGGEPLAHDIPLTGDPVDDGWTLHELSEMDTALESGYRWPALIDAEGDVRIWNTRILGADETPRWFDVESDYGDAYLPDWANESGNTLFTSKGGHINVVEANLSIEWSELTNIPVVADGCDLFIDRTEISGDADLLTLHDCSGAINKTDLVSTNTTIQDYDYYPYRLVPNVSHAYDFADKYYWGLSIEGALNGDPIRLHKVLFNNSEVGLDLNNAVIEMDTCEFSGTWTLGVWDHATSGLDGWANVRQNNSFVDTHGFPYLRTQECDVTFTGPTYPDDDPTWYWAWSRFIAPERGSLPRVELVWTDGAGATVFVPEEMMDPNGTLHSYDNLTVRFETSWSGSAIYNISTSDRAITVQLPPEEDNGGGTDQPEYDEGLPNVDPYVGMYRGISADTVEVLCQLEVDELYEHGYHQESVLALYLDGVLQSEIDMLENTTEDTWYTDKMTEMVVSPGSHEINWTLWATKVNETEAVTIANGSGSFFRISDENMIGDAIDCLNEKLAGLMVDPDLRLTIDGLEPFKSYWTDDYGVGIRMILGEGAHVELSDLSSTLYDFVYVSARGPGTVVVNGADCWEFDLYPRDTHIQVKNVYTGYTYISGRNSMVRFDDCTLGGGIDFPWDGSCDISFYDCELDMGSWSQYYGIEDGSLVMDGCTVVSEENWSFKVRYEMNSTVTVRDCDFMNASLVLVPWGREGDGAYGGEADVTGCTFSGGGAYLSYIDERDSWSRNRTWEVETRIVGNRFIGEDCGLIIDGHRFVEALGPNTFDEGATLFASYFSEFSLTDTVDYYSNYSCFLMLDGVPVQATYRDEPPGQWSGSHWKEGMSIVPVTYIMGEEPNPGRVWAVLRDGYKGEGEVLYFYEFDPAYKDVHYVPYPDWRDISGLVLDLKVAMGTWGDGW